MKSFGLRLITLLLLAICVIADLEAQTYKGTREISGIVRDENGAPLPAAHIREIGPDNSTSTMGAVADLNGHFHLVVDARTKKIEISFLGYDTQIIELTQQKSYDISMQPSNQLLNEVVVTGYQTISRERTTGSFTKINAEKLNGQRLTNISSLLDGNVAGYSDGKLRGVTSMNGLNTPLYVIDGFPIEKTVNDGYGNWIEQLPDINVEDIDNITVLKDAAATSIYGARAANGVVVITTKKAKQEKAKISFSTTLTAGSKRIYTGHLAGSSEMVDLEREWAVQNPGLQDPKIAAEYAKNTLADNLYKTQGIRNILRAYAGEITDAEKEEHLNSLAAAGMQYYRDVEKYGKANPFMQQYNLSIGKATSKNAFNASVTYNHRQESDINSHNQNLGVNLQNTLDINRWLTAELGTYIYLGNGVRQTYDLLSPGFTYMPYDRLINLDGSHYINRTSERMTASDQQIIADYGLYSMDIDPLAEQNYNLIHSDDFSNRSFLRLNAKILDGLRYSASFLYEYGNYKTDQLLNKESFEVRKKVNAFATDAGGKAQFNLPYGNISDARTNHTSAYNFRQQLDYNKTFGQIHNLIMLAGMEIKENKSTFNSRVLYNYDPEMLSYSMVDAQTVANTYGLLGWDTFNEWNNAKDIELVNRFVSAYANAAYSLMDKYAVTGSIRWDRTNLFSTSSKYQNKPIWSLGASWIASKEDFMKYSWLDLLKVRFSYGIGGNIAKNSAPYMTANYYTNNHVGGLQGNISSRPNPNLRWEKTTTLNFGADFAFFRNRLMGSIDFYHKKGVDLLANMNGVPTEGWGYSTYSTNNGQMVNRGFELTLSGDVISNQDFRWNIGGVLGYNKNEIVYVNVKAPVLFLQLDYPSEFPRVGTPYNSIYGYQWGGLSADGLPQVIDANGKLVSIQPLSSIDDAVNLGTSVPIYNGAINTSLRYKNWDLYAQISFEGGHQMRNTIAPYVSELSSSGQISNRINERWQKPGDETLTNIPRFVSNESPLYYYDSMSYYINSSANILQAHNIRLSKISLNYYVPSEWTRHIGIADVRLMLGVENAYMWAASREAKYLLGGYQSPNYLCGLYLNF